MGCISVLDSTAFGTRIAVGNRVDVSSFQERLVATSSGEPSGPCRSQLSKPSLSCAMPPTCVWDAAVSLRCRMQLGVGAGDRIERFLRTHPTGRLIVCVGSASVSGLAWLAERTPQRPVTLLIGDLQGRNFQHATDVDRRAASEFVQRSDVDVRNWYRTARNAAGRSEAHLKVWAACNERGAPHAYLVGSANLTTAGFAENVELMTVADSSEHDYLNGVLEALLEKSWLAKDPLVERIAGPDAQADAPRQHRRPTRSGQQRRESGAPKAQAGCGKQAAALAACVLGFGVVVLAQVIRTAGISPSAR